MFTARFSSTPDGLVRKTTKLDKIKSFTNDVATRKTRLPDESRKRVLFVVKKTNEVRCWPYNNFLTLMRTTHPGEIRIADANDLARIHGDPEDFYGDVAIPQSQVDRFIDNVAHGVTASALDYVQHMKKEARKQISSERRKIRAGVPRIKPSKPPKAAKKSKKSASKPKKSASKPKKSAKKPKKSASKSKGTKKSRK